MKTPMFVCYPNYFEVHGEDAISMEIKKLEKVVAHSPEKPHDPAPYLQLALLYSRFDNPAPDYLRSLHMFEQYFTIHPDAWKDEEIMYMKDLVQQLVGSEREQVHLAGEVKKLKRKTGQLKAANAALVDENQKLADAIEKLKLLEFMLEEKRRSLQ